MSSKYPAMKSGGVYKVTKPKYEQKAIIEFYKDHGTHHRLLCIMLRSWKDNLGLPMGKCSSMLWFVTSILLVMNLESVVILHLDN